MITGITGITEIPVPFTARHGKKNNSNSERSTWLY
jgi:hypothetical protein